MNEHGNLSIKNFGEIPLPDNTFKEGEILNKDALIKVLSQVKERISVKSVKVSVSEEQTYIFEIKLPKINKNEIDQALVFHLEENVPFKADEVYFEHEIISDNKEKDEIFLNVSVIPKKIIENYVEALTSSGLFPVDFEIESKMTARSVIAKNDGRKYVIVDIKDDSTIFSFVEGNIVRFTSTVSVGENSIKNSLSKSGSSLSKIEKDPRTLL